MDPLWSAPIAAWNAPVDPPIAAAALTALEAGAVVFLPDLAFRPLPVEAALFTPAILGTAKNASFDPVSGRLGGTTAKGVDAAKLREMIARFSAGAATLVDRIVPRYCGRLTRGRASFRPAEIAGRKTTWRKDDTRLHIDSFPASPVHGQRILRVFTNVNPEGRSRSWRIGEPFEDVGRRFAPRLRMPAPGTALMLRVFGVTKSRRSPYDAMMLQLHDLMKADAAYQDSAPQTAFDFPAGSSWMAFTDQVSHAAIAGQYQLEQTFLLPVAAMSNPERSPLRILERLLGRALI